MSSINTGYCEIMSPVGTGDCEFTLSEMKNEHELAHMIASEVVGDIVDNAMEIVSQKNSTSKMGDIIASSADFDSIIDSMEKVKIVDEEKEKKAEINKLPYQGIGDQLEITNEIVADEQKNRHPIVEKKSRLTDLVKNSKQLLSKYIMNENIRHDNPEDDYKEKELKVIEISNTEEAMPLKTCKIRPEDVPLPVGSEDLFKVHDDENLMDVIHLEKEGIGDTPENIKKTMTFPIAGSSSSKSFSMSNRYRTLKMTASEFKKKKWNIGTKFLNYLKKHKPKKDEELEGVQLKTD